MDMLNPENMSATPNFYSINPNATALDVFNEITLKLGRAEAMVDFAANCNLNELCIHSEDSYLHFLQDIIHDVRGLVHMYRVMEKSEKEVTP